MNSIWFGWDDKGWHEYVRRRGSRNRKPSCKVCGFPKAAHLSKPEYVTQRLLHGKTQPGLTWEELTRKTNEFIQPLVARQMGMTRMHTAILLHKQSDLSQKQLLDILNDSKI